MLAAAARKESFIEDILLFLEERKVGNYARTGKIKYCDASHLIVRLGAGSGESRAIRCELKKFIASGWPDRATDIDFDVGNFQTGSVCFGDLAMIVSYRRDCTFSPEGSGIFDGIIVTRWF